MLKRLGFRRVLSLFALALYFALVVLGAVTYKHGTQRQAQLRQVIFQENIPFQPTVEPVEWRFATLVNMPGVTFSTLTLAIFAKSSSELYILLFSTPFVPFTW